MLQKEAKERQTALEDAKEDEAEDEKEDVKDNEEEEEEEDDVQGFDDLSKWDKVKVKSNSEKRLKRKNKGTSVFLSHTY